MNSAPAVEVSALSEDVSRARLRRIGDRLVDWFRENARDLPWRRDRDGYTALVAEAMLQQTQVARVVERYEEFLRRFPDVESLARADEQAVLAAWRGLGYYRRARHLHRAAQMIVEEFGGEVPATADHLRRLPGVGRYTAGAVASIVHGERAAMVDGNVQRVLARVFGLDGPPGEPETISTTWSIAEGLVNVAREPDALNEGLMELGATVCTPVGPQCGSCPLSRFCAAKRTGRQAAIPPPKARAVQRSVHHHAAIVRRDGLLLLEQRGANGLWSNMWQPPTVEAERKLTSGAVRASLAAACDAIRFRESFTHQTTHRRITFHVYEARGVAPTNDGVWRRPDDTDDLPMGAPHRRIVSAAAVKSQRVKK